MVTVVVGASVVDVVDVVEVVVATVEGGAVVGWAATVVSVEEPEHPAASSANTPNAAIRMRLPFPTMDRIMALAGEQRQEE